MAAVHGRNGRLYVDVNAAASGNAVSIPFMADYSINQARDRVETTTFDDNTKTYVAGMSDASGTINGFYDDSSNQLFTVADGAARKFYLYVDVSTPGTTDKPISGSGKGYWYGTATFDVSTSAGVGDVAKVAINWSAASSVAKV